MRQYMYIIHRCFWTRPFPWDAHKPRVIRSSSCSQFDEILNPNDTFSCNFWTTVQLEAFSGRWSELVQVIRVRRKNNWRRHRVWGHNSSKIVWVTKRETFVQEIKCLGNLQQSKAVDRYLWWLKLQVTLRYVKIPNWIFQGIPLPSWKLIRSSLRRRLLWWTV